MRVLKFGGAALGDGDAVRRAVQIVQRHGGRRPTVVVSAHAGVTVCLERAAAPGGEGRDSWNLLRVRHRTLLSQLELPAELLDRELRELRAVLESLETETRCAPRVRDHLLSFGERLSARVFAATLRRAGLAATPVDAFDLGIRSAEGRLGSPTLASDRLLATLREIPGIPVVTGFLALDPEGHLTTLGPNGSDLTAAWFGAALGAEEVHLWKCIPGFLTADPSVIKEAILLPRLDWLAAQELARHGSAALHPDAVQPAYRAGIPLRLRDVTDPEGPGTRIGPRDFGIGRSSAYRMGERHAKGPIALAHRERVVLLRCPLDRCAAVSSPSRELTRLFSLFVTAGIEPHLGWIGTGPGGGSCAEFILEDDARLEAWDAGAFPASERRGGLATIAIVGRQLQVRSGGTLERALEHAHDQGAREVSCQGTVRIPSFPNRTEGPMESRVLLLDRDRLSETLEGLHRHLFLEDRRVVAAGRDR